MSVLFKIAERFILRDLLKVADKFAAHHEHLPHYMRVWLNNLDYKLRRHYLSMPLNELISVVNEEIKLAKESEEYYRQPKKIEPLMLAEPKETLKRDLLQRFEEEEEEY
jgi:hypothetical protein